MPTCESCGKDVRKLTTHTISSMKLCLRCITQSGMYTVSEEEAKALETASNERRTSLRVPVTLAMTFVLGSDRHVSVLKQTGVTVDVSTTGLCLAWDACEYCSGYAPSGMDEHCILYPYSTSHATPAALTIDLQISKTEKIRIKGYAVHTTKEDDLRLEYVGIQFVDLGGRESQILEHIVAEAEARQQD